MRITQALATKAANLLTLKTDSAIEALENEIDSMSRDAYIKTLPKGLLAFDKANPGWITKDDDLRVIYMLGGKRCTYYVGSGVLVPVKDGGSKLIAGKVLRAKIVRLEQMRENYRTMKKEIYAAVLVLGTSKQVIKAFPETAELFGTLKPGEAAPAPKIIELKKKLQKQ